MSVTITIPDSIANSAHLTEEEIKQEIAITLYQKKRLTFAQARRIADLSRIEFQRLLGSHCVAVYDVSDFEEDMRTLDLTQKP